MKKMVSNIKSLTFPTCKRTLGITAYVIVGSIVLAAFIATLSFAGSEASLGILNLIDKLL